MRLLIITMEIDETAAGMVFGRIIEGLTKYATVEVICSKLDNKTRNKLMGNTIVCNNHDNGQIRLIGIVKNSRLHYRIEKKLFLKYGYNITDKLWARLVYYKTIRKLRNRNYDAIMSFVYGGNIAPLVAGDAIKKRLGLPWVIYSVDALPTPEGWLNNDELRNKMYLQLNKYISHADAFFSANPTMSRYEKNVFKQFKGTFGVVLTPFEIINTKETCHTHRDEIVFLYAGFLYGPRKVKELLGAFEIFNRHVTNSRLVFVGDNDQSNFIGYEQLFSKGVVKSFPFTNSIEEYYNIADVLIDINANIKNDVFLSSKICNYLHYDKPIISISESGSPVREMMSGYQSIVHCTHHKESIFHALNEVTKQIGKEVNDREKLKQMFSVDIVSKSFYEQIELMLKNNKVFE